MMGMMKILYDDLNHVKQEVDDEETERRGEKREKSR